MKFGMRWFGAQDDPIPLQYIRQVPNVTHVVGALFDVPVGEVWPLEEIEALRDQIESAGLAFEVVESVNIHDDIKIGGPERDRAIENYIATIKNLATVGVKVICYNFMPVFDWVRTDLHKELSDGSHTMAYEDALVQGTAQETMDRMNANNTGGHKLPGWEPERLAHLQQLLEAYAPLGSDGLAENFRYFIQAIMPACERYDVKMAMHPDDPPKSLFGLPRIAKDADDLRRIESFHDSPYNGFTLCTGSLGENPANDVPALIREFAGRDKIPFAQIRNIKFTSEVDFHESAHLSSEGSLDMYEIMRAFHDAGFDGYARSDHGRDIWGEQGRPGYGLYDRALGTTYLSGLWEAITKSSQV
ncbi:mannonate dehydratase [Brooklawnia cerclae]|uniref:Mannonate dehydratase n=1 Tax=Brooklawnia cerclae TaxID=349934 RepID=A0ABX0SLS3_9ACTN|nr:mannonate dehydratase [Brooklawnia cerclae]